MTYAMRPSTHLAFSGAFLAVLGTAPALACNPLEFLFGGCRETQILRPSPPYYDQRALDRRTEPRSQTRDGGAHRAARATANGNGVSGKQKPLQPTADAPIGSLALFERDRTLRRGDIIVTVAGFMVSKGAGDFAPIAHDGGALARLEQASVRRRSRTTTRVGALIGMRQTAIQRTIRAE